VGVAHGDIRELNIIFKTNVVNGLHCYIIDFGNSALVTRSLFYSKLSVKSGAPPCIDNDDENAYNSRLFENEFSADKDENEDDECFDYFRNEKLSSFPSRFQYLMVHSSHE
jgi:hypothetical protein